MKLVKCDYNIQLITLTVITSRILANLTWYLVLLYDQASLRLLLIQRMLFSKEIPLSYLVYLLSLCFILAFFLSLSFIKY